MKHPVHPLIVHFPIACWSLSTFGDLAGIFISTGMTQAIGILLLIGCISAVIAMVAGLYELTKLNNREAISETIDHHMYAAITAWCFYLSSLYLRWADGHAIEPNTWALSTSIAGFISLVITGWHGANLVYVYEAGIRKLSK